MGRTETRARLIEAGGAAMMAKSYHAVGLKEILERAGVPKGSFYHYFQSKEDFCAAVIEHAVWEHAARIRGFLADENRSPLTRLREFFRTGRDCYKSKGFRQACLVAKLAAEVSEMSPNLRAALKDGLDQWRDLFAEFLRQAQAAGEIPENWFPEELAGFIQASWEGAVLRMQVDQDEAALDRFRVFLFEHLLGISPDAGGENPTPAETCR
jgi:TetR/AcrR family transcriptional repressor of nem operon